MVFSSGNPEQIWSEQNPAEAGGKLCLFFARLLCWTLLHQSVSNPSQCMGALKSILFSPFETNEFR